MRAKTDLLEPLIAVCLPASNPELIVMAIKKYQRRRPPSTRSSGLIDPIEPRRLFAAVINSTNSDDASIITVESHNSISLLFNGATLRIPTGVVLNRFQSPNILFGDFEVNGVIDLAGGALISRAGGPTPAAFRTMLA